MYFLYLHYYAILVFCELSLTIKSKNKLIKAYYDALPS